MAEFQEIVQSLESGQEPLDESLAQFERGMKLLRSCHAQLENAAARIEVLTRIDADGNVETKPFASKATSNRPAPMTPPRMKNPRSSDVWIGTVLQRSVVVAVLPDHEFC